MNDISELYDLFKILTAQPECRTCSLCEEHVGLVYLLDSEAEKAKNSSLPVLTTSTGVQYLGRTREGWCCSFDPDANTCRIYEQRPLCCRIYPLDLMQLDGEIWWVIHSECPIAQRFQRERMLSTLAAATSAVEGKISESQLKRWMTQDRFSQMIEAFSYDESKVIRLRRYGEKRPFP